MKVNWTLPAIEDVEQIEDYIARDAPYYAQQFIEGLFSLAETLRELPHRGRHVPEAGTDNIRELFYQRYRIIYQVDTNCINILAVIHGARNLGDMEKQPW